MRLSILILFFCVIGSVFVGGCTNTASTSNIATPIQTLGQPTQPTAQIPVSFAQTTIPVSNTDTICGEMVYCGYAPAGLKLNLSNRVGVNNCTL